jgi:hypothetical protein
VIRLLAIVAACATLLTAAAQAGAAPPAPRALTLRLADFGPGYYLPWGRCFAEPMLADSLRFANRNCVIAFAPAWTSPGAARGPGFVMSAAVVFKTPKRAAAVLAYPRLVASLVFDPSREDFEVMAPAPAIGDEAALLRASDGSAVVVWRSGAALAAVLVGHGLQEHGGEIDPQVALALAATQQARIASPTPLLPSDDDASEVPLDDPGLGMPVYWLGHELPPRGDLPALTFSISLPAKQAGGGPVGPYLLYGRRGDHAGVIVILLARREVLRRPSFRRELRQLKEPCAHVERLTLPTGRATIYWRGPQCPELDVRKTPDAFDDANAIAILPEVVVFVSADGCVDCHGPISRYESPAGMRRIVRALRPRA